MEEIRVTLNAPWWHDPLFVSLVSSALTGLAFALVLQWNSRRLEKRDILSSLQSELAMNFQSLCKLQNVKSVKNLDASLLNAIKEEMPWNKNKSDIDIFIDFIKNTPVNHIIKISCWEQYNSKAARYHSDHKNYKELYDILLNIIRYSRIKSGELKANNAELFYVNQHGAIRISVELFLEKFKNLFPTLAI
jgi:hypothetical protein